MIRRTDTENSTGTMEEFIRESGNRGNRMGKVFSTWGMGHRNQDSGREVNYRKPSIQTVYPPKKIWNLLQNRIIIELIIIYIFNIR